MDVEELRKLIFSRKDVKLMNFLKENINSINHSNSVENLRKVDYMDEEDRRFLIARLESIYEKASLLKAAATCITLLITLIILFITVASNEKKVFKEIIAGLTEGNLAIFLMIFIIIIFIGVIYICLIGETNEKADSKYYLSLFKIESKK